MADPFERERVKMVSEQLLRRGISDPRVLEAFRRVPRHLFVPAGRPMEAYEDRPVPIGEGQTISQPYFEALRLQPGMKVLEIGTGSGYQAALLAEMGTQVYTVERIASLAETAAERLKRAGFGAVHLRIADGSLGWPEEAPFDAIAVSAAAPRIPERLVEQLSEGGRMVVPIGDGLEQMLTLVEKQQGRPIVQPICSCLFVPLIT